MGVEQKQAKKPRVVRGRVTAGVVATSLAVAAAVAVPAAGAIGGPGFGLGDEAPGIDVPGTGVKEPWATIEVNGEEPKDYYDEGSVDVKVTVGPGDDYVASRILVNGSAQDDWARTDLADGSHVYEKALAEEGTYRLVVINDMAWGDALMPCAECRFAIDRTAPQATVAFDSDEPVDGFPGRGFAIETIGGMGKKELKRLLSGLDRANIAVRNFPLTASQLRKKLKLADGGDAYLFGTTMQGGDHVLIRTAKISR